MEGAVPTIRPWKHASIPRHLTADQVEEVLKCCGEGTPIRRRDRAVVLMLARLGMRAGEVAALRMKDIDWREGIIRVRPGKSGRERFLPMSAEVGTALVTYLSDCRHCSNDRSLFLRSCPPHRGLKPGGVSGIAKTALLRAGITGMPLGSHTFRHTVATLMVQRGVAFKEIADVLGHDMVETTLIYAKLDIKALSRVALPWPEVTS